MYEVTDGGITWSQHLQLSCVSQKPLWVVTHSRDAQQPRRAPAPPSVILQKPVVSFVPLTPSPETQVDDQQGSDGVSPNYLFFFFHS